MTIYKGVNLVKVGVHVIISEFRQVGSTSSFILPDKYSFLEPLTTDNRNVTFTTLFSLLLETVPSFNEKF